MATIITLVKVKTYGPKGYCAEAGCPFGVSNFCISGEGEVFCKGVLSPNKQTYLKLSNMMLSCYAANRVTPTRPTSCECQD
jgi:hypothetical protein